MGEPDKITYHDNNGSKFFNLYQKKNITLLVKEYLKLIKTKRLWDLQARDAFN